MFLINNIQSKKMYWKKYSYVQHMNKRNMLKELNKTIINLDNNKITIKNIRKKVKNKQKYLEKIRNIKTDKNILINGYIAYKI